MEHQAEAASGIDAPLPRSPYPYCSFGLFERALERLRGSTPLPGEVDLAGLGARSESSRRQLGQAMRALGLLGPRDERTLPLRRVLEGPAALASLLASHYGDGWALGLRRAPDELDAWFASQGLRGDTVRRARRFLLNAVSALEDAGVVESVPPGARPSRPAAAVEYDASRAPASAAAVRHRERYVELLLGELEARTRGHGELDVPMGDLLDRIERAVGFPPATG